MVRFLNIPKIPLFSPFSLRIQPRPPLTKPTRLNPNNLGSAKSRPPFISIKA
ncbi:hypothetical protein CRYUN_Cryun08bG0126300 [Craigia yunnanensis]